MKYGARTHAWRTVILVAAVLGCEVPAKAEAGRPIATIEEARAAVRRVIGSGPCRGAGLRAPLGRFGEADLGLALAGSTALFVSRPDGYEPRFAGFIRINAPGVCTGLYLFDHRTRTFTDLGNSDTYHLPPILVEAGKENRNETVQALKVILSQARMFRTEGTETQRTAAARGAGVASREATGTPRSMGLGPAEDESVRGVVQAGAGSSAPAAGTAESGPAPDRAPSSVRPAPTPRPVIQTVYREVETPSRLMQVVESRVGWLVCGGTVLGILLGLAMRGSGSRQIVISAEEHARAAAQLEQRLRADTMRLRSLSSAVDQEEARYIQRVSAITRRS